MVCPGKGEVTTAGVRDSSGDSSKGVMACVAAIIRGPGARRKTQREVPRVNKSSGSEANRRGISVECRGVRKTLIASRPTNRHSVTFTHHGSQWVKYIQYSANTKDAFKATL